MKVNVHIERLILDGLPVRSSQGSLIQASIERELARLLNGSGVNSELMTGGAVPHLPATSIQFTKDAQPARLGQQIAGAVHGRIGGNHINERANSQRS